MSQCVHPAFRQHSGFSCEYVVCISCGRKESDCKSPESVEHSIGVDLYYYGGKGGDSRITRIEGVSADPMFVDFKLDD